MTLETHVDRAHDRASTERTAIEAKRRAYDAFVARVEDVQPQPARATGGLVATAGQRFQSDSGRSGGCSAVREAFAKTVYPHSVDDLVENEPVLETIRCELSDSIAVVLAPASDATLTEDVKRTILDETAARRAETDAMISALDREASQLADAAATVDEITDWIATADETPLPDVVFDDLHTRHQLLDDYRRDCEALLADRQAFLQGSASASGAVGIRHRTLVEYCYDDFPIDHPILSTAARLYDTCSTCQRTVRSHLVRRG